MPIKVSCPCGHAFNAPSKYAGKKVKCPKCKDPIVIPAPKQAKPSSGAPAKAGTISVQCKCGKALNAKAEWAGKKVKCPACGDPVVIPAKKASLVAAKKAGSVPAKKPESAEAATGVMSDLFDEIGFGVEEGGAGRKCPECKAPLAPDAIVCIQCGYNENTGKKMQTIRPVTAKDRAKRADVVADNVDMKTGRKKPTKRGGGYSVPMEVTAATSWLYWIGFLPFIGVALLVVLVASQAAEASEELGPQQQGALMGLVIGYSVVVLLFNTAPCVLAAWLIQRGKFLGIILAYIIGGLSLFGFPLGTFMGIKLILAVSDDVVRSHCS